MKPMSRHEKQWLETKIKEYNDYKHQQLIKEIRRRERNNTEKDVAGGLPGFLIKVFFAAFVELLD